jgi:hypothetical protein
VNHMQVAVLRNLPRTPSPPSYVTCDVTVFSAEPPILPRD